MSIIDTGVSHPRGIAPASNFDVWVFNRSGATLAVGDVVQFDMNQSQAETTSVVEGAEASIWANVIDPVATATGVGIGAGSFYAVALESIADNAEGKVRVRGKCQAYVIAASGSVAIGDPLVCAASNNLDLIEAAGEPYHAIALSAATTPTARTLIDVMFDGIGNTGTFVSMILMAFSVIFGLLAAGASVVSGLA